MTMLQIDPDLPFVLAGVTVICGTVITLAKIMYGRGQQAVARPPELQQIEDRLAHIEQAIDAMAVETERISEGQRFTTKLLADSPRARVGAPDTPPSAH